MRRYVYRPNLLDCLVASVILKPIPALTSALRPAGHSDIEGPASWTVEDALFFVSLGVDNGNDDVGEEVAVMVDALLSVGYEMADETPFERDEAIDMTSIDRDEAVDESSSVAAISLASPYTTLPPCLTAKK
jgi:hypothetical protein